MHTATAVLMTVFGDVGEQREVAECPHHAQCLFDAEPIEFMIERGLERRNGFNADITPQCNRQLPNMLNPVED